MNIIRLGCKLQMIKKYLHIGTIIKISIPQILYCTSTKTSTKKQTARTQNLINKCNIDIVGDYNTAHNLNHDYTSASEIMLD